MKIKVTINYAPKTNGKKFDAWCKEQGFDTLNSGRRAWCGAFNTYLRDAIGIATTVSGESFLVYPEDL